VSRSITGIDYDHSSATVTTLDDGTVIATDIVIYAMGVQPNSELARTAHLAMHNDHIVVNEYLQTSDPSIFAAGDVACMHNQATDYTWAYAAYQGRNAAYAMTGNLRHYEPEISLINSHFFGLTFAQAIIHATYEHFHHYEQKRENAYLYMMHNNNIPISFQFIGNHLDMLMRVRRAMVAKIPF
jgi:NAD(P)H-nitrite reductase large subunit